MKTVIKAISTFDGRSLDEFSPPVPHNFQVLLHLTIGTDECAGGSDFTLSVCTPMFLDHSGQREGPIWGRNVMVVNNYSALEIKKSIEEKVSECERSTFEETVSVLSRFFFWEFEDYTPFVEL